MSTVSNANLSATRLTTNYANVIRFLVLAGLLALALSRSPYIFFQGRFWAEEGSVYFSTFYSGAARDILTFVYSRTGYYSLFMNAASFLATLPPLQYAPLVTAWLSIAVLLWTAWLALAWPLLLLPHPQLDQGLAWRSVAATLIVAGPGAHPEVWANSINAQTYFGVLSFLATFVVVDTLTRGRYLALVATVIVAVLSSPYSVALAPLWGLRWMRERSRRVTVLAVTSGLGAALQAAVAITSRVSGQLSDSKLQIPSPSTALQQTLAFHLSGTALGPQRAEQLYTQLDQGSTAAALTVAVVGILVVLGLLAAATLAPRSPFLHGMVGVGLVLVLVHIGSHGDSAGGRYAVVPIMLLTLLVLAGAAHGGARLGLRASIAATAATATLGAVLVSGFSSYWTYHRAALLACSDCPHWGDEIRDDKSEIAIWPYPRWTMRLETSGTER